MSKATGDNTSTASAATVRPVTRRTILAGAAATIGIAGTAIPTTALNADAEADPVVILWRQYRPAADEARRLGNRIAEIEGELPEHPGVNLGMVLAIVPTGMAPVGRPNLARCPEEIERFATDMMSDRRGFDGVTRSAWVEARKAELVEVNRQMKGREEAAGLPELRGEQDRLDDISGDLYSQIEKATATTPAGLAVKLLIAFEHTDRREFIEDLPSCLYASMLRDILPFCPADVAAWARPFVEAGANDEWCVGACLDIAREKGGDA